MLFRSISDKLSEYANAFVDVAKDPYILKIIYSERIVNSFMLLERIGVPTETTALFMNQPIIKKYINYLDSTNQGAGAINNKKNLEYIRSFFTAKSNSITQANELLSETKDLNSLFELNISDYVSVTKGDKASLTELQNAQQQAILNEFLKINDLAQSSFDFTQAMNYDTTSFKNEIGRAHV